MELEGNKGKKMRARVTDPVEGWSSFNLLKCDEVGCNLCKVCKDKNEAERLAALEAAMLKAKERVEHNDVSVKAAEAQVATAEVAVCGAVLDMLQG